MITLTLVCENAKLLIDAGNKQLQSSASFDVFVWRKMSYGQALILLIGITADGRAEYRCRSVTHHRRVVVIHRRLHHTGALLHDVRRFDHHHATAFLVQIAKALVIFVAPSVPAIDENRGGVSLAFFRSSFKYSLNRKTASAHPSFRKFSNRLPQLRLSMSRKAWTVGCRPTALRSPVLLVCILRNAV